ncbi:MULTISPECIES: YhjD/YihY/BrkB family envelope integrity protein [Methylobacillus]|uniref:Cyclic nucleotide-binding domain (cNMP-BD) protein n=1 Tax=Methylobacillus flagellatus (strain ATCC 51484 / DSM 6875 / VKM B-1610 / KT) TaxID=265072 RepID=Q1GYV4_METFK|nr:MULTISPECIES: YhjD/YihY/BrkB family envelope integrity protein [Methylobacillus]ABE50583.1 cyclic nucleotide-binding domain (cNMP-BD) protein [Methylobacillus flagellatus KT]MPS50035.1 YihY family inner membrane protein [Methylobacillus sp.]
MALNLSKVKHLGSHPALHKSRRAYARHRYSTPFFVLRETLNSFQVHNGFGMSASLSFYAMFALIPLIVLMFFLLSHLVVSSNSATVKLAIIVSNLVPNLSNRIMVEVYNASQHKAAWGVFGFIAMFWLAVPLAGALRSAFYTIAGVQEKPSFMRRQIKDILGVLGILLMFFLFTILGLGIEKVMHVLEPHTSYSRYINSAISIALTTLLIAMFYRVYFPLRLQHSHIVIGAAITALLWLAMRPAFSLFLSINPAYGAVFGGMKNLFISIAWLYYTFVVFMLGTTLVSILHKKDVLLLRGLFGQMPDDKETYLEELMERYGKTFQRSEYIFKANDSCHDLYYLVSGQVKLMVGGKLLRELNAGDYFGEMAFLTQTPRVADAIVTSDTASVVVMSAENIETLLRSEPDITMNFLRQIASRLQHNHIQGAA